MFKKESIYNNDGELVTMRTTQYKGHSNDDRGYVAYYNGKTIMNSVDAVYLEGVKDTDIGKMVRLSKHLLTISAIKATRVINQWTPYE